MKVTPPPPRCFTLHVSELELAILAEALRKVPLAPAYAEVRARMVEALPQPAR